MKFWHRLSRKWSRKTTEGQVVLSRAYQAVFRGNPDRAQQDMVLADLMAATGWNRIIPASSSPTEFAYHEGKRAAFSELFGHLSLGPEDIAALENAARYEVLDRDLEDNPS